ncbi:GSCFA domain-containing protein [Halpernia frigidisoli]|uniref:GSCFA family protein n=1 Tax=Halpernia frigidisoli TaxID=1125876 RepID=A0A1I3E7Y8_9FLAO|nr:GSCFA domain-containing protein [Halpernia frigidisoli]SFH95066.1 GSCFA family protein [Halpernia frigidisoli]
MKFRTEVDLPISSNKINLNSNIFSIGSCFSAEISAKLLEGQLQSFNNPFGTLFNPYSINKALKKIHDAEFYTEEDLIKFNGEYISLDHNSTYNSRFSHQTLDSINHQIQLSNEFLKSADFVIITLGTSFIYEFLPKKKLVANCHKIPAKYFEKRYLTHLEICDSISETISLLKDICSENVQILFSISPVRHTKDGITENQLSKAKLFTALHEVISTFEYVNYLPVYEMMIDDLRDYRFYKDDLIHPNSQAIQYIWEKFVEAYFTEECKSFFGENLKIRKALEHKTDDTKNPKYLEFQEKLKLKIASQQAKVNHKIF